MHSDEEGRPGGLPFFVDNRILRILEHKGLGCRWGHFLWWVVVESVIECLSIEFRIFRKAGYLTWHFFV